MLNIVYRIDFTTRHEKFASAKIYRNYIEINNYSPKNKKPLYSKWLKIRWTMVTTGYFK